MKKLWQRLIIGALCIWLLPLNAGAAELLIPGGQVIGLQLREDTDGRCPTREAMRYLAREPLLFEPGDQYHYSLCHDVILALVEVLSGQLFDDYAREHIFDPLGMKDTTFLLPMDQLETVSAHYVFSAAEGKVVLRSKFPPYRLGTEYASGGAGCVSTVNDYIKFLEALRIGDVILKKDTIQLMVTNQLSDYQRRTKEGELYGYGLGLRCPFPGSGRTDFGWGGAAGAYVHSDPEREISIVYLQHMLNSKEPVVHPRLRNLVYSALEY
jgi:CubicO group peptidase (beta-lactamase class C family)